MEQNKQTFYYTNMTAQYSSLNQGQWNTLESKVQAVATVTTGTDTLYVVTGPLFDTNSTNVAPTVTTIDTIESRTGLDFYTNVPISLQTAAESQTYSLF